MVWISCFVLPLVIFYSAFEYIKDFLWFHWNGYRIVRKEELDPKLSEKQPADENTKNTKEKETAAELKAA